MMLGPFPFEATGFGYTDVQRRVQTPWADIPVAQDINQQQWTGPTSDELTVRGVLFPAEFPASLDGLIAASNAGTPLMFVSGDAVEGVIHGMFTIQAIDEDRSNHDRGGRPWRNGYTIALKRYGTGATGFSTSTFLANLISLF
jgi:phage protein U